MDPSCLEKVKQLAVEDVEDEHLEAVELALSNSVVLREIFKFLPASALKNCNLVNKLWKNECYLHCRDKMKWVAKIPKVSPCASLREFNELIGSMAVVPYNGLQLHIDIQTNKCHCPCNSPQELFTNVLNELTWRHLDILINFEGGPSRPMPACTVFRFGMTLLREKIDEVENLHFQVDDNLQFHLSSSWPPQLLNLQSICFPFKTNSEFWGWGEQQISTSFLTRLTTAAVNLKEIKGAMDFERLKKIPEEKWKYVKDFICPHLPSADNVISIASQFVSERPALKKLQLNCDPFYRPTVDDPILLELLQLSLMTLEDFKILSSACRFDRTGSLDIIALPQLPKLRVLHLHMTSGFGQAIVKAQSLLNLHDGQVFPQLEEFHLSVDTIDERYGMLPRAELRDESDRSENVGFMQLEIQPCCSVSKLGLEVDPASSSFVQARCLFPAVTDMRINCQRYVDEPSRLPYKQIFRLWQNLEVLSIENEDFHGSYNLDYAFCGLHAEEVEYLRQKGDKFLRAVQLVPIAPCVLTMRNLVSLSIECQRGAGVSETGTYMTRFAQVLAERYLPHTLVKVPCGPA